MPADIKKSYKWVWQTVISLMLAALVGGLIQTDSSLGMLLKEKTISMLSIDHDWTPQIEEVLGLGGGDEYEHMVLPVSGIVTRSFGWYLPDEGKEKLWHEGINIKAQKGQPVKAAAAGTVEKVDGDEKQGYRIILKHRKDLTSVYAYLGRTVVSQGQEVKQGETIGEVGSFQTHFQIRVRGSAVDPLEYLRGKRDGV